MTTLSGRVKPIAQIADRRFVSFDRTFLRSTNNRTVLCSASGAEADLSSSSSRMFSGSESSNKNILLQSRFSPNEFAFKFLEALGLRSVPLKMQHFYGPAAAKIW